MAMNTSDCLAIELFVELITITCLRCRRRNEGGVHLHHTLEAAPRQLTLQIIKLISCINGSGQIYKERVNIKIMLISVE